MRTNSSSALLSALSLVLLAGCAPATQPTAAVAPTFESTVDTKQLMDWVLDPQADVIWGSVGTIITEQGTEELAPKSDAEWDALRNAAVVVAETGNLLMMPGRAPAQEDWMHKARGLIEAAKSVRAAVDARDVQGVFDTGGKLYESCVACHAIYSYAAQGGVPVPKSPAQ